MSVTGEADRPPSKPGISLGDTGTGMLMASSIIAALFRRQVTGQGHRLQVAMQDAMLHYMRTNFASHYQHFIGTAEGAEHAPDDSQQGIIAERVETEEELKIVQSLGIDQVQGHLTGRPTEIAPGPEPIPSGDAPADGQN